MTASSILEYLSEITSGMRFAILLDGELEIAAAAGLEREDAIDIAPLRRLVQSLRQHDSSGEKGRVDQAELSSSQESLYVTFGDEHVLLVATDRVALPALVTYDCHMLMQDIESKAG